mmetsp:Transcript_15623/g.23219  ORF Transcript_15623/g.23219 Transcript_15623/m.23219 type:complete len:124 (-) Transcript_15623:98-469(-)
MHFQSTSFVIGHTVYYFYAMSAILLFASSLDDTSAADFVLWLFAINFHNTIIHRVDMPILQLVTSSFRPSFPYIHGRFTIVHCSSKSTVLSLPSYKSGSIMHLFTASFQVIPSRPSHKILSMI